MSNLSYCRFRNTLQDLRDCWREWEIDEDDNEEEVKAKKAMIELIKKIVEYEKENN